MDFVLWLLTELSIWIVCGTLLVAIFTDEYDDTFCQRVSMAGVILCLGGRASEIWDLRFVTTQQFIFYISLCGFTVSTAIKVVYRQRGLRSSGCFPNFSRRHRHKRDGSHTPA
jgi:hypothetical protein